MSTATAIAHPNIAFIKYWGNTDDALKLPVNSSISMNLATLQTETRVTWHEAVADSLILNGVAKTDEALTRVSRQLDVMRQRLGIHHKAEVISDNNFPMGAGIASSASSFAALTVAAAAAASTTLSEHELSTLARLGSGSASRSVPAGFVEWHIGHDHDSSFAESILPPQHWELVDVIAVVSQQHKKTGSEAGHPTARTSPLQTARVAGAEQRVMTCRQALIQRDFEALADVVELDSNLMHAVMMTSQPSLMYWLPASLGVMHAVRQARSEGLPVCYTLDAGPNVHCICEAAAADELVRRLQQIDGIVDIIRAGVGGASVVKITG